MSTAVSMNNLIQVQKYFREITVDAFIVAAYAALLDRLQYHNLSKHIQNDVLLDQAINATIAIYGKSQDWRQFRDQSELK